MSNIRRLDSMMGTNYVINSMEGKFKYILDQAILEGFTIDLADVRLGPQCEKRMRDYYGHVMFINSASPELNNILEENSYILADIEEYPILEFPDELTEESLIEFCYSLTGNEKFRIELNSSEYEKLTGKTISASRLRETAFAILAVAINPRIEWDIYNSLSTMYDYMYDCLRVKYKKHDKFILICRPGFEVLEVDENGCIGRQGEPRVKPHIYANKNHIIPYSFSTEIIYQRDETTGKFFGDWAAVMEKCTRELQFVPEERRHLDDILQFKEFV